MRGSCLVPIVSGAVLGAAQALAFTPARPACAEEATAPPPAQSVVSPAATPALAEPEPVVALVRAKLADPDLRQGAHADDLAALEAFYEDRSGRALWMTDMGFSAKGQQALFEIDNADAWGLDQNAFDLPPPGGLPAGPDAQAVAEIKLNLAVLQYARFARGGRADLAALGGKVFLSPPLRDPQTVLAEIASAEAPDAYLRSLHPKHDQFVRLRQAMLEAREAANGPGEPGTDTKRIILNMERWRWMPEKLGRLYVWSNTPAFMLYVVKDGATIYADKTQVGTVGYATPVMSANMTTVVFNPEWIAPPTVLRENLLPELRKKNYAILKKKGFSVSYQGKPVDASKIDWARVNVLDYTFTQMPGPHSNVGKVKFLMPNRHAFILHDTWPARRKHFQHNVRAIGHDCVRMEKPDQFASVILAEANGWSQSAVKHLWVNAINNQIPLDSQIPVYSTYFTVVADASSELTIYPDLYGLDHKLSRALFGDAKGFPMPAPATKPQRTVSKPVVRAAPSSDISRALQGFAGN